MPVSGESGAGSPLIELEDIQVRYGSLTALSIGEVRLPRGAVGLLGPNGAGKSTLLKTLLGLLRPASGRGTVLGIPIGGDGLEIRRRVGYMSENDAFVADLTSVEFVRLAGELAGMPRREAIRRAHEVLSYLELDEARYRRLEEYSTGMKQRLKLALALVHDPDLLVLDEPTNGLDPSGRRNFLDLLATLCRDHGKSILISTHLLEDVERLCESVLVLRSGEILAAGRIEDLRDPTRQRYCLELRGEPREELLQRLAADGVRWESTGRDGLNGETYRLEAATDWSPERVFEHLGELGASCDSIEIRRLTAEPEKLETLFSRWVHGSGPGGGLSRGA